MDHLARDRTVRHRDNGTGHADVGRPTPERIRHVRPRHGLRLVCVRERRFVHRHTDRHRLEERLHEDLRRIGQTIAEVRWDHNRLRVSDGEPLNPDVETLDHRQGHGPDREAERLPRVAPAEGEGLRVGRVVLGHGRQARIEHEAVLEPADVVHLHLVPALGPQGRMAELRDDVDEVDCQDGNHEDEHPHEGPESAQPFLIPDEGAGHGASGLNEEPP